jgi:hypothetical protein
VPACLYSSGATVTNVTGTYPTFAECKAADTGTAWGDPHTYWLDYSQENSGLLPDLSIADANDLMLATLGVLVVAWGFRVLARAL